MKLKLPTVEETDKLGYRVPVSIKAELDHLAADCKREKLDFALALAEGLREMAKAIRKELDNQRRKRGPKAGTSLTPEASRNGAGE